MSRGGSTLTRSSVRERSLESWTRPLPLPASPLGSGTRSDGRCAAASGVPSCPLPEPHRRRPSPVPASVSLSPVSCALPEQHSALPHAPSADESPTSWRSLESFHHHAHTRVESARIAPPWLSCPPGPPLGRLSPKRSTRYMVFSKVGPNQSIEWAQIRVSKSKKLGRPTEGLVQRLFERLSSAILMESHRPL